MTWCCTLSVQQKISHEHAICMNSGPHCLRPWWRRCLYPTEELCVLAVCYRLQSRVPQTPAECVSRQAALVLFGKEDVAILLLTSVAWRVLCRASWGVLFNHQRALYYLVGFFLFLSALAAEPALNFFLNLHLCQRFVLFAVHFFKMHQSLNIHLSPHSSPLLMPMPWRGSCDFVTAFVTDVTGALVGKRGFP